MHQIEPLSGANWTVLQLDCTTWFTHLSSESGVSYDSWFCYKLSWQACYSTAVLQTGMKENYKRNFRKNFTKPTIRADVTLCTLGIPGRGNECQQNGYDLNWTLKGELETLSPYWCPSLRFTRCHLGSTHSLVWLPAWLSSPCNPSRESWRCVCLGCLGCVCLGLPFVPE